MLLLRSGVLFVLTCLIAQTYEKKEYTFRYPMLECTGAGESYVTIGCKLEREYRRMIRSNCTWRSYHWDVYMECHFNSSHVHGHALMGNGRITVKSTNCTTIRYESHYENILLLTFPVHQAAVDIFEWLEYARCECKVNTVNSINWPHDLGVLHNVVPCVPVMQPVGSLMLYDTKPFNLSCYSHNDPDASDLNWSISCSSQSIAACRHTVAIGMDDNGRKALLLSVQSASMEHWNGANVSCETRNTQLTSRSLNIRMLPVPPLLMVPNVSAVAYLGMTMEVKCVATELWLSNDLRWDIECNSCRYRNETSSNEAMISLSFDSTMEWNDATIYCSADRELSQKSSIQIVVRPVPLLSMQPQNQVTTYLDRVTTVTCMPNELWTVDQLSWSITNCQNTPINAAADQYSPCQFISDEIIDEKMLKVTFSASLPWNGSEITCSAVGPPIGQRTTVNVLVNVFQGLTVVPPDPSLSLDDGVNSTVLCATVDNVSPDYLIWTTSGCSTGPCPEFEQGLSFATSLKEATSRSLPEIQLQTDRQIVGWKYASLRGSSEWHGATLTCWVTGLNDASASRSLSITVPSIVAARTVLISGASVGVILSLALIFGSIYYAIRHRSQLEALFLHKESQHVDSSAANISSNEQKPPSKDSALGVPSSATDDTSALCMVLAPPAIAGPKE